MECWGAASESVPVHAVMLLPPLTARAGCPRRMVRRRAPHPTLQESKGNEKHVALIQSYREKIEKELSGICADVIGLLQTSLIPKAGSAESKVFYHKMCVVLHGRRRGATPSGLGAC